MFLVPALSGKSKKKKKKKKPHNDNNNLEFANTVSLSGCARIASQGTCTRQTGRVSNSNGRAFSAQQTAACLVNVPSPWAIFTLLVVR